MKISSLFSPPDFEPPERSPFYREVFSKQFEDVLENKVYFLGKINVFFGGEGAGKREVKNGLGLKRKMQKKDRRDGKGRN